MSILLKTLILEKFKQHIILTLLFITGFTLFASCIPLMERWITENTEYIKYNIPVIITKSPVESCEDVPATFIRTSSINISFYSTSQIINTRNNRIVDRSPGSGWIDVSTDRVIDAKLTTNGCLEPGFWKFQGSVNYIVKGVSKAAYWESQTFEVITRETRNINLLP